MLPYISTTKSAIKKTMTISTTNNTRNKPTSTYYYKVKSTPKNNNSFSIQNLDSYKNKNSNNASKKSKIMNNSTNINSTSNSNFYENLYYYPPHNNKYSYANNISSEVCFLYSDFNFNKAPSLKDNLSGIRSLIKNRKKTNIHYLNNLFFSSLCQNKLSQTNIEEYYEAKMKDIELLNKNMYNKKKPERNNSCMEFVSKKKSIFKEEPINNTKNIITNSSKNPNKNQNRYTNSGSISTTTYKTINTNKMLDMSKDNIQNKINIIEKPKSKNNNLHSNTTNIIQEFTPLPKITSNKPDISKSNDFSTIDVNSHMRSNNIGNIRPHSFITDLNTEKMNFRINECIFESKDKIKKLNEFEIKIYQMKIFQGFQKAQLDYIFENNIYSVERYADYIDKIFKDFNIIYKRYNYSFQGYIKYLVEVISDLDNQLKSIINQHIQLEYDVDALLNKNINKQRELERLIDMRNFLFRVKHKDEIIPDIDSTLFIESRKYELVNCLKKLFEKDNNITVIKFLNNMPSEIPDISDIDNSKFIVKNCPPLLVNNINEETKNNDNKSSVKSLISVKANNKKSKRNKMREKELEKEREREKAREEDRQEYIKKNVLTSPEDLIQIIIFLEDQNRFLLRQNENKRILIEKYKEELENLVPKEEIDLEKKVMDEIVVKKKELEKVKFRYNVLEEQYNQIFNINLKNDIFKKVQKKPKKSDAGKSSFADFNYFQTVNYNFKIKKAKYPGLVFFGKLLKIFQNFLSMNYDSFTKEKFYTHISPDHLNEILEYTDNLNFNDRNSFLIYQYIIKLLKLYEYICEYVFKKDVEYNMIGKNQQIIKKEKEKIANKRKLDNARTIRILIENKRINANKQLIEKWKRPEKYISRKVDNNNYKILLRNRSQDDIYKRKKNLINGNGLNEQLNGFIHAD